MTREEAMALEDGAKLLCIVTTVNVTPFIDEMKFMLNRKHILELHGTWDGTGCMIVADTREGSNSTWLIEHTQVIPYTNNIMNRFKEYIHDNTTSIEVKKG